MVLALVTELGLGKESISASVRMQDSGRSEYTLKARTLAERRVFLGAVWLGSMFVDSDCDTCCHSTLTHICVRFETCSRDFETLQFGEYTERCCRILEETDEYPTDIVIVQLVRMQRIAENSNSVLHNAPMERTLDLSSSLSMRIEMLKRDLTEVGASLRQDLPQACEYIFLSRQGRV